MKPAKIPELFWQYESLYIPIGRWKNECVEEDLTLLYSMTLITSLITWVVILKQRTGLILNDENTASPPLLGRTGGSDNCKMLFYKKAHNAVLLCSHVLWACFSPAAGIVVSSLNFRHCYKFIIKIINSIFKILKFPVVSYRKVWNISTISKNNLYLQINFTTYFCLLCD